MRVLGIDPGLQTAGYACVQINLPNPNPALVEAGALTFNPKHPLEDRLLELHESLTELITELKPTRLAVEQVFAHYKHPRTAVIMGHGRGVVLLAAKAADLVIEHLPSTEVKKAITGNGHATKSQIQLAVQSQCNLAEVPEPPDVADAIAIALTSARRLAYEALAKG
jgi:crossover junction endodeoxyribonuclease RuvC